jgi:hypothetical protein
MNPCCVILEVHLVKFPKIRAHPVFTTLVEVGDFECLAGENGSLFTEKERSPSRSGTAECRLASQLATADGKSKNFTFPRDFWIHEGLEN